MHIFPFILFHWTGLADLPHCDTWPACARQVACAARPRQQSKSSASLSRLFPSLLLYGLGMSVHSTSRDTNVWAVSILMLKEANATSMVGILMGPYRRLFCRITARH